MKMYIQEDSEEKGCGYEIEKKNKHNEGKR